MFLCAKKIGKVYQPPDIASTDPKHLWSDEEDELSDDDEADTEKDDITNPPSLPSRIYSWVLSIFGLCNKKQ